MKHVDSFQEVDVSPAPSGPRTSSGTRLNRLFSPLAPGSLFILFSSRTLSRGSARSNSAQDLVRSSVVVHWSDIGRYPGCSSEGARVGRSSGRAHVYSSLVICSPPAALFPHLSVGNWTLWVWNPRPQTPSPVAVIPCIIGMAVVETLANSLPSNKITSFFCYASELDHFLRLAVGEYVK